MDVFRADSDGDEAGEEAAEHWAAREEAEGEGGLDGGGVAEGAGEEVVGENLKGLGDAGGEFAALLDVREGEFGDNAGGEDRREDAGGGYGVLNGEVDADAADGGHGVGSVADAEEAGTVPASEAVDLNGEELDLAPACELFDAGFVIGAAGTKKGNKARDGGAEGGQTGGLDVRGEAIFGDDEGALEVLGAIDEDSEGAVVDVADDVGGIAFVTAEAEPEDIDGDSLLANGEIGGGTGEGVAAVATNDESGSDVDWTGGSVDVYADDAVVVVLDEAGGFVFHEEVEVGEGRGLCGEEVEEVPLGHEGDEFCVGGYVTEIGDGKRLAADDEGEVGDLLVREGEKGVEDAQLVHEIEGGGMDGVAAEVAKEVFVFFKDGDVNPLAGEQEAKHDTGGPSTDDAAGSGERGLVCGMVHGGMRVARVVWGVKKGVDTSAPNKNVPQRLKPHCGGSILARLKPCP
jgi:hypothetical protein